MENITVIIERNDDGTFTAVPQHKHKIGFIGMGKTVEETMSDLQNSYNEAKEMLPSLPEMTFEYKFDTASFLQYINGKLNLADLQTITGINRHQLSHYATGKSRPSVKTVRKIQEGIIRFSEELHRVCLV
ncbi:MAG: helix-turn-helix transcriptional regulator [Bacteroidales bacterium]|nr:helix-turn-helix transcriptional regulator [Bacteroidales bacterium]MBO7630044.1 helix-turn-helix transcriptional regulator [Bacteroidales bacterium]MCR4858909.1 helix-turn-helix domain-containing protein [Bacteroidales bacterium]